MVIIMRNGSNGKLLRVNLTKGTIEIEELDPEIYRLYPGGKALAVYLLLKELPAGVDPLGPDNMLVMANGLLTGAPLSTATRYTVAARSPLTGTYGESEAGGYWGPELKNAGYEAIVFTGKAAEPVYLWIQDGKAELRSAAHLWGQDPDFVQTAIRSELGDDRIRILQIGLGGENLVRYAAITNELRHFNGRNGLGAVMGSKNLKAVAVRGHMRYAELASNPEGLNELGKVLAKSAKTHPLAWDLQNRGTPALIEGMNAGGMLPTRNFRQGAFEAVDKIKWEAYEARLLTARRSCYACAVRCKREVQVKEGEFQVSQTYGGPEYEAVAGFSSNCGVDNIEAMAKANELCNRFTLDAISTSMTIAFAMECFEHGLITLEQTGGIDLRFGNAQAMVQMVELIARREGIGDLLAEGSYRAGQVIGGDAPMFTLEVKGQELPMHDPRGKVGVGIGYAVSENGADHLVSYHDTMLQNPESVSFKGAQALGITEALPARELSSKKMKNYWIGENWSSFEKSVGLCYFGPTPRSFIQVDQVISAVRCATGWDVTLEELLQIGERATNLARIFNIREGFSAKDDSLPERLFSPLEAGALTGVAYPRDGFAQALKDLYELKGWQAGSTIPTPERLKKLKIEWAGQMIQGA
jgi:aldehyde:ferredoxin oxidoreductase